jgi:hypothetical protein
VVCNACFDQSAFISVSRLSPHTGTGFTDPTFCVAVTLIVDRLWYKGYYSVRGTLPPSYLGPGSRLCPSIAAVALHPWTCTEGRWKMHQQLAYNFG